MRNNSPKRTESILSQPKRHIAEIPEIDRYPRHYQRITVSSHACETQLIAGPLCEADHALIQGTEGIGNCASSFAPEAGRQSLAGASQLGLDSRIIQPREA